MEIKNMPDYAKNEPFIVYRVVSGEAWFYGAYDDFEKANHAACEVGGVVMEVTR